MLYVQLHMNDHIANLKLSWIDEIKRFDSDDKFLILLNNSWMNLVLKLVDKWGAITTNRGILIINIIVYSAGIMYMYTILLAM